MWPVCIATTALAVGAATSTGGLTALALNRQSPTRRRMTMKSTRVDEKPAIRLEPPRLENRAPLLIAGLRGSYTAETRTEIPALWQRFGSQIGNVPGQVGGVAYGVCFKPSTGEEGFGYLSGVEVSGVSGLPQEFSHVSLPARRYAVFPHRGHVSELYQTCDAIWQTWLPGSGHEVVPAGPGGPTFFERYGEAFDPGKGMGDVEVWIPIES
jgi:AraC family transcriptional regulator